MKFFLVILAAFSIGWSISKAAPIRKISIHSVTTNKAIKELKWYHGEKEMKLQTSSSSILPFTEYQGAENLKLYSVDQKLGEKPLVEVTLPKAGKIIILMLVSGEKQYSAIPISVDEESYKPGSRLIVNVSSASLKGEIGKLPFVKGNRENHTFSVSSGGSSLIQPILSEGKPQDVQVVADYRKKGIAGKKTFLRKKWHYSKSSWKFVLIFDQKGQTQPHVKVVSVRK